MPVIAAILWVLPYLLVLTLVVTVHELGHFLVARGFGIKVDIFSIGFGPPLFHWRDRYGVEWRLSAIPFGGYVKFAGDEGVSSAVPDAAETERLRDQARRQGGRGAELRLYHLRPVWERAAVAAAGPAANFLLAVVLFTGLLLGRGDLRTTPRVQAVMTGSAASAAGFQPGDLIVAMNTNPVEDYDRVVMYVQSHAGDAIGFTVRRGAPAVSRTVDLVATPRRTEIKEPLTGRPIHVGQLGLYNAHGPDVTEHIRYSPTQAVAAAVGRVGDIIGSTVTYLGRIVRGLENGDQLGGPIRMAAASHAIAVEAGAHAPDLASRAGMTVLALLSVAAVISVAIGFMNLLPIPVLDGGHLVFYAYEALARRPAAASVQAVGTQVGLVLVLALMLFATWNDLRQHLPHLLGGLS